MKGYASLATTWAYPRSPVEPVLTATMRYVVIVKRVNTGFTRTVGSRGGVGYSNNACLTIDSSSPLLIPRVRLGSFCDRQHADNWDIFDASHDVS